MNEYFELMKPFGPRIGHFVLSQHDFDKVCEPAMAIIRDPNKVSYGKNLAGMIADEPMFDLNKYPEVDEILSTRVKHYMKVMIEDWRMNYGSIEVTNNECWLVNQRSHEYNPAHTHGGCNISGVMYLQVPKEMTIKNDVKFKFENSGRPPTDGIIEFINGSHREMAEFEGGAWGVPPVEGHLLIFPSRLTHTVYPFHNRHDESRISLSFNSTVKIQAPGSSMMQMLGA